MSSLTDAARLPLHKVAALYDVHVCTVHRWRLRGVKGIKLETTRVGGRRYTTAEWLDRFHAAVTAAADGDPSPPPESDTSRQKRLERVDTRLLQLERS